LSFYICDDTLTSLNSYDPEENRPRKFTNSSNKPGEREVKGRKKKKRRRRKESKLCKFCCPSVWMKKLITTSSQRIFQTLRLQPEHFSISTTCDPEEIQFF